MKLSFYDLVLIIGIGLVIAYVIFYFWTLLTYGGTPLQDCPIWVIWVLGGGKS